MQIKTDLVLGCRLDIVDMDQAMRVVEEIVEKRIPSQIVTLNAEMIYHAQKMEDLKEIYSTARLVTPDGIGTVWALRRQGHHVPSRVTGVGLTYRILDMARDRGLRVYLLGAGIGIAAELEATLKQGPRPVRVVGSHHGYFSHIDEGQVIADIQSAAPDILLVAMGAPRQDQWIFRHLEELQVPLCIGIGGTFDVLAGKVQRAPLIWRRMGLEWCYRLIREPSRIKRQMALPKFVWLVLTHPYGRSR